MRSLAVNALSGHVGRVPPKRLQLMTVPRVGCSIAVGVDSPYGDGARPCFPFDVEECYAAPMPVGGSVFPSGPVVPIASNVKQGPIVYGGQLFARHTIETSEPLLAAVGDDSGCVDA